MLKERGARFVIVSDTKSNFLIFFSRRGRKKKITTRPAFEETRSRSAEQQRASALSVSPLLHRCHCIARMIEPTPSSSSGDDANRREQQAGGSGAMQTSASSSSSQPSSSPPPSSPPVSPGREGSRARTPLPTLQRSRRCSLPTSLRGATSSSSAWDTPSAATTRIVVARRRKQSGSGEQQQELVRTTATPPPKTTTSSCPPASAFR